MKLKDKVQHGLDEARMLVLGAQVLLGFDFESFLMKRFDAVGTGLNRLQLVSLGLMLATLVLLLSPAAYHRIVLGGEDREALVGFTRRVTAAALFTFALGLAGDVGFVVARLGGTAPAIAAGAVTAVACFAAWYALPWLRRREDAPEDEMEQTDLNERIRHVLTEARVVLPGTQALLGFQFIAVLEEGFDQLPPSSRVLYVVALALLAASIVLLMLPAAYHRIAEGGEISERLQSVSSRALVAGMMTLAGAIAADTFIVVRRATGSAGAAAAFAIAFAVAALGAWVVAMLVVRRRHARHARGPGQGAIPGARAVA